MDNNRKDRTTEANIKLNQEFYGEETESSSWVKNGSRNETVNANMEIDHIFNQNDEGEFDLLNSTSLRRGNG